MSHVGAARSVRSCIAPASGRRLPESWSLGLQRGGDELLYRLESFSVGLGVVGDGCPTLDAWIASIREGLHRLAVDDPAVLGLQALSASCGIRHEANNASNPGPP
jgi:hypothetical protein